MSNKLKPQNPSERDVKKAVEYAGKKLDETDQELNQLQAQYEAIVQTPNLTGEMREQMLKLSETMIAKANLYYALMGRMEALCWTHGYVLKRGEYEMGIGVPFLPAKEGVKLWLPNQNIQA